jgi:hypothetical protein
MCLAVQGQEDAQQRELAAAALAAMRALAAISAACAAAGHRRGDAGAGEPEDAEWLADGAGEAVACQVPERACARPHSCSGQAQTWPLQAGARPAPTGGRPSHMRARRP